MLSILINDRFKNFCGSGKINFDFLRALILLAKATAPAPGSKYQTNSIWTIAKYANVHDPRACPTTDFFINPGISDLDPHQKTILSDEIGVAVALGLLDLHHGIIGLADVYQLVSQNIIQLKTSGRHRKMPDFLILLFKPLNGRHLILLECKGSQMSRAYIQQLRTACRSQLDNVASVAGITNAPKLAFATRLRPGEPAQVHIADPPVEIKNGGNLEKILRSNWLALEYSMFQDFKSANEVWGNAKLKRWDISDASPFNRNRQLDIWQESVFTALAKTPKRFRPKKLIDDDFYNKDIQARITVRIHPSGYARSVMENEEWTATFHDSFEDTTPVYEMEPLKTDQYRRRMRERSSTHTGVSAELETELWIAD